MDDMIDWATTNYNISRSHIFTTGHSWGAYFSYCVARWRSDDIAAFAEHSGGISSIPVPSLASGPTPKLNGILLHAVDDGLVNYSGTQNLYNALLANGHNVYDDGIGADGIVEVDGWGPDNHRYRMVHNQTQWDFFMSQVNSQIYVDDDAPGDPGPGDSSVSDPAEDGTVDHPYDMIQEAINVAFSKSSDTVIVYQGTYSENINFYGKNIVLTSTAPNDTSVVENTVIDGGGIGPVVTFAGIEDTTCQITGFTITGGNNSAGRGGGISGNYTLATIENCVITNNAADYGGGLSDCDGTIRKCVISDNAVTTNGGGVVNSAGTIVNCLIHDNTAEYGGGLNNCDGVITNCTVVYNNVTINGGGLRRCDGTVANCIIWGNAPDQLFESSVPTYSCFASGTGTNIDVDPAFVNAASSDYHLMPSSLCIDTGDLISDWSKELFPNGSRVNMGAYGNTSAATRKANYNDLAILASQWLQSPGTPSADIVPEPNGDGTVNFLDFAAFAEYWVR